MLLQIIRAMTAYKKYISEYSIPLFLNSGYFQLVSIMMIFIIFMKVLRIFTCSTCISL